MVSTLIFVIVLIFDCNKRTKLPSSSVEVPRVELATATDCALLVVGPLGGASSAARQSAATMSKLAGFGQTASLIAEWIASTVCRFCEKTWAASSSVRIRDQHASVSRTRSTLIARQCQRECGSCLR